MKLFELAHARAGDKGNISNIVVVSRTPASYATLVQLLTAERVKSYFDEAVQGVVLRYELPKLHALNFVMYAALQGGVTRSTALDTHGKSLASALLNMTITEPANSPAQAGP